MKVSFLILTFVLILATNTSAKRFDDDNNGYRKSSLRGGDANVNIKVRGRRNPNPKDEYRCTTVIDNTDGFDCSVPRNCDPNEDRCFKKNGANSKCALYTCSNSKNGVNNIVKRTNRKPPDTSKSFSSVQKKSVQSVANSIPTTKDNGVKIIEDNGMKTIEYLRNQEYEELDIIPYVCVNANFDPDKKDTQCVHKKCHKDNDYTKKGSCPGNFECKIVSCVAKYAVKNNYLSFKNIPGLHHEGAIKEGHDPVTFAPWKCVPNEMNQPLNGGKDLCDKHEFCYDKKDPMRAENNCQPDFKCVLEENCPYVIMHKKFDNDLFGASEFGSWPTTTKHGVIGAGDDLKKKYIGGT